jgi:DNA-binding response OmpR family regulator
VHVTSQKPAYKRVVIVEDDVTLRGIIARNLSRRGVDVVEVGSAEEAMAITRVDPPDLLLVDVNLPVRSGWDVLRDLRSRSVEVPTVIISAVRPNEGRLSEFKPLAYLPKPFPLEALLRIVISGRECQEEDLIHG